jgi:hypothetical protein
MRSKTTAVLGAAAMVLWASAVSAQAKPDFNGKWAIDAEKTAAANPQAAGGGGGGGGRGGRGGGMAAMTLTVDAANLTVESEGRGGPMKLVYKLDGAPGTVTQGQNEVKYTSKWDGNTIVLETTRTVQEMTITTKAVYALEGEYLVVSTTRPGRDGGAATTTKAYYKKAA